MPAGILGGRYLVQDKIGAGGMATVYRGRDEVLGRTVAIKTMLPQYAHDASFAARFKQEAQAAAALQSPYIVSVYDWGEADNTYYIVMEYLRGTDLKSGIRKHGALNCKKVAQIASQIAQALSVAHRHDIIHRDIKPQNIMVQPDGNIKVMDFGIARAKNSQLTTDNSVLGTAHYVSPEQTQGKPLGPTTDIYSLGIVMYEAVTGQVPFQGDEAIAVALKQVNEQPTPPSLINSQVDPALESIILKCMEKNPQQRYQSADDLNRALREYLSGRMNIVPTTGATATTVIPPAQNFSKLDGTARMPLSASTMKRPRPDQPYARPDKPKTATQQAEAEERERKRKERNKLVATIAGVGIALVCVAMLVVYLFSQNQTLRPVPNLLNYTQEEAVTAIQAAGFTLGEVKQQWSSSVAEGRVCDQDPLANRKMPAGTAITIWISKGEEPAADTTVPDLSNLSAAEAEKLLNEHKLKGSVGEDREDDKVEKGKVAAQDTPAGSKAKAGDTVVYHLSSGPKQVVLPKVVGDTEADAKARLSAAEYKFTVKVQYAASDTVAKGTVISTTPTDGTTIAVGSTVTITVSSGRSTAEVPAVIGMDFAKAKRQLEDAGFKVKLADGSSTASGVVVDQSETGTATKGTTIVLTTQERNGAN